MTDQEEDKAPAADEAPAAGEKPAADLIADNPSETSIEKPPVAATGLAATDAVIRSAVEAMRAKNTSPVDDEVPGETSSATTPLVDPAADPLEPVTREPIPQLKQILEGAILAADKPLNVENLMSLFDEDNQPTRLEIRTILEEVQSDFEGRGFELKLVASGYRFQVRSTYSDWIGRLWDERPPKYTRAFLETLALIAYKQPITRGDIEEIRGVTVSTNIMRSLLEREWIRIVGHRDVPGRPAIYATTREFLDYFDLSNLDQLPTLSEIKDLDSLNEELDLKGTDLIEPRTLTLNEEDQSVAQEDETSLDEVTAQVNQIQENIKNLFKEPEEDEQLTAELADVVLDNAVADNAVANETVADNAVANDAVVNETVANEAVSDDIKSEEGVVATEDQETKQNRDEISGDADKQPETDDSDPASRD